MLNNEQVKDNPHAKKEFVSPKIGIIVFGKDDVVTESCGLRFDREGYGEEYDW